MTVRSILPGETPVTTIEELALALGHSDSGFFAQLLRLVAKADPHNRRLLAQVFPRQVDGYETWMRFTDRHATVAELLAEMER